MQRVCFTLKLRPDRVPEYIDRHRRVWPEMQAALRDTGWGNYTLFLGPNALLIGYLETEDFEEARRSMQALAINRRWQTEMAPFFEPSETSPDDAMRPLPELFHLD
ncbi:MAG: L-rhamnose mutarotase [Acidobacteriota bacterium]|nr:L-rhamnose mutarotase [Acidobacteriota bacterium]